MREEDELEPWSVGIVAGSVEGISGLGLETALPARAKCPGPKGTRPAADETRVGPKAAGPAAAKGSAAEVTGPATGETGLGSEAAPKSWECVK